MRSNKIVPMKGNLPISNLHTPAQNLKPPAPAPKSKTDPKQTGKPQQPTKTPINKTDPSSNEINVEVGESKCSLIFGYTLSLPFIMMAGWYGYMMYTFQKVTKTEGYSTSAAIENVLNVTIKAKLPLANEFAPYYRYFLSVYLSKDYYVFMGTAIAHVISLLILAVFVFNLSFSHVNQQSFTALAFGNLRIRRVIKRFFSYSKTKGLVTLFISLIFSSVYALPFIMVPMISKGTFEPVLTGDVSSSVFKYLHYVYYSASLGAASSILIIWFAFLTACFKFFGPQYLDFEYMRAQKRRKQEKKRGTVVMGVARIG